MHAYEHERPTPQQAAWRPWREDLLTAIGRGGEVEVEPAPWLSARQLPRTEALVNDLREYQALSSTACVTAEAARARRLQGGRVATRLTELLKFGVRVRWRDGDPGVRLRFQRARR